MGFRAKSIFAFLILTVTLGLLTNYLIYQKMVSSQNQELREKLIAIANIATISFEAKEHPRIRPEAKFEGSPLYLKLREQLWAIQRAYPQIRRLFTMVRTEEGSWVYVVDSRKKNPYLPGEYFDSARFPKIHLAERGTIIDEQLKSAKLDTWITAYAPIKDEGGKSIAVLGLDLSIGKLSEAQMVVKGWVRLTLTFGVVLSIFLGTLLARGVIKPIQGLTRASEALAKGDLSSQLESTKRKDEIGHLINSFNKMNLSLRESQQRLKGYFFDTLRFLAQAVEDKDPFQRGHSQKVTRYALKIAKELGLPPDQADIIQKMGPLHEIGNIGIRQEITHKPGKLTESEWAILKKHTTIGESILKPLALLAWELALVRSHHERVDGKGYPDGLKSEMLHKAVAAISVACAFVAMTSARPYREPLSLQRAIEELQRNVGTQFDASVVNALLAILRREQGEFKEKETEQT